MTILRNSAEGGTDETAATAGNSGGASGDAWSQVNLGAGSTIVYDSAQAAHGLLSYNVRQAASQVAQLIMNITADDQALVSFYLRFPAAFTVNSAILQIRNASGNAASLNLTTAREIQVNNAAGASVFTTAAALAVDTWYRLELRVVRGTTTGDGTIQFAYYLGDSTTPIQTFSSATVNAGTTQLTNARLGRTSAATADVTAVWVDSVQIANAGDAAALGMPWPAAAVGLPPRLRQATLVPLHRSVL